MNKKILFVDDEKSILKALSRSFIETDYEIFIANSGAEALEILASEGIGLIVSDMRMPHMDGFELLSEIKKRYPSIIRIILSGHSDESIIFNAIKKSVARLYVFKPWDNDNLTRLVDQVFETEKILNDNNVLKFINGLESLPTIKANYQKILQSIENDNDISKIAELIERDQSVATKLLQVANSAFYGAKTGSIKQAVTYLGLSNVENLILSTSLIESFGSSTKHVKDIWEHAFVTNKILIYIYEKFLNKKLPEIYMSSGLLHNIGKVLMLSCFKEKYLRCIHDSKEKGINVINLEKEIFGVTHLEVGAYLLKTWELPFSIVEAALYHHNPINSRIINKELLCAIHIAQKFALEILKIENNDEIIDECFEYLKINKDVFEEKVYKSISL